MKADSTYIEQLRVSGDYEYISDIESVKIEFEDHDIHGTTQNMDFGGMPEINHNAVIIFIAALLCAVLAFVIHRIITQYKKSDVVASDMGQDDIYGHDWEKEIEESMANKDYSQAVVLCYLRWLHQLNSDNIIDYHHSKTPYMFIDEVKKHAESGTEDTPHPDHTEKTRILTSNYLAIRYGHRKADLSVANKMIVL